MLEGNIYAHGFKGDLQTADRLGREFLWQLQDSRDPLTSHLFSALNELPVSDLLSENYSQNHNRIALDTFAPLNRDTNTRRRCKISRVW